MNLVVVVGSSFQELGSLPQPQIVSLTAKLLLLLDLLLKQLRGKKLHVGGVGERRVREFTE